MDMASLYAAGMAHMLNDSSMPSISPAATAPMLLPSPPSMATVKPLIASPVPLSYWVCVIGDTTAPASAPMPALSTKESVTMFFALMPQRVAASRLDEQARIWRPSMVMRKNALRASTTSPQAPMTHSTWGLMYTPPNDIELISSPVK